MADTNNTERAAFEAWAKDNLWPHESQAAAWRAWSSRARLAPQPNAALADGWLNPEDMAALERADECFEDGEGHDLPKARMDRLIEIGVMRHNGGGFYSITSFGRFVLGCQHSCKPLETFTECGVRLGREYRAKNQLPTPPTLNASKGEQP